MTYAFIQSDARRLPLADKSVHCVVTSPPYFGLRDYGVVGQIGLEKTYQAYLSEMVAVMREVRRVLRDDGTVWLNVGDSYAGSGKGGNPQESEHQKHSRVGGVPNVANFVHGILESGGLFIGQTNPRRAPAERLNVFIYDQSSPDRILHPLLGVQRITIKQGNDDLCEIGDSFDSPIHCFIGRSLSLGLPNDPDTERPMNVVDNLAIVIAAGDLDTDAPFAPSTTLPIENSEASFTIEVAREPVAERIIDVQAVRYSIAINSDTKSGTKIDLVNEPVSFADRLLSPSGLRGNFAVRKASREQLHLSLVGGRIQLTCRSVGHVFSVCDGGIIPYGRLLEQATRAANANRPKQEMGISDMLKRALMEDGWICRQTIIWSKPNPMPESVRDRCTKAHEYIFLLTKKDRYFFDQEAIKQQQKTFHDGNVFGGVNKHEGYGTRIHSGRVHERKPGANRRSVWTLTTEPCKEAHFATYPSKLVELCVKAGTSEKGCCPKCGAQWRRVVEKVRVKTRPGDDTKLNLVAGGVMFKDSDKKMRFGANADIVGNRDPYRHISHTIGESWQPTCECGEQPIPCTVFDPFSGAGTTALTAARLGRRGIGTELNPEYIRISLARAPKFLAKKHKAKQKQKQKACRTMTLWPEETA